jgi:hypothetical protein
LIFSLVIFFLSLSSGDTSATQDYSFCQKGESFNSCVSNAKKKFKGTAQENLNIVEDLKLFHDTRCKKMDFDSCRFLANYFMDMGYRDSSGHYHYLYPDDIKKSYQIYQFACKNNDAESCAYIAYIIKDSQSIAHAERLSKKACHLNHHLGCLTYSEILYKKQRKKEAGKNVLKEFCLRKIGNHYSIVCNQYFKIIRNEGHLPLSRSVSGFDSIPTSPHTEVNRN